MNKYQTRCCYCGMHIDATKSPRMYRIVTKVLDKNNAVKSLSPAGYAHNGTCSVWMSRQKDFGGWMDPVKHVGPERAILNS